MNSKVIQVGLSISLLVLALGFVDLKNLGETVSILHLSTLGVATILVILSVFLVFMRFHFIMRMFGYRLNLRDSISAFTLGQISNTFLLNIIGQVFGRAYILSNAGVPLSVTTTVTIWERILSTVILAAFGLAGGYYIFAKDIIEIPLISNHLVYLFGGLTAVTCIVLVTTLGFNLVFAWAKRWAAFLLQGWPSVLATILSQLFMLAAYMVIIIQVSDTRFSFALASGIFVIMFAASLPISISGWGIREISSIKILGAIGFASTVSVTAAISIGLISLLVLIVFHVFGTWLLTGHNRQIGSLKFSSTAISAFDWAKSIPLFIAYIAAILVFFQIRIEVGTHTITANLADAIVLAAMGLALVLAVRSRDYPRYPPVLVYGLAAFSLVLIVSLLIGWSRFGLNDWALVNRGIGWIFILGYIVAGGAFITAHKERYLALVLWCFALTGSAIGIIQLLLLIVSFNVVFPSDTFVFPLRGYAGNSNVFALQMILVAVAAVVAHGFAACKNNNIMLRIILSITALATYFSMSRSGLGTYIGALILLFAVSVKGVNRRARLFDCLTVAVVLLLAFSSPTILSLLSDGLSLLSDGERGAALGSTYEALKFEYITTSSDNERWSSIIEGWELWLQHPIFGAGLGAYVQYREDANLSNLVIHSIPVWILAELGIVGMLVVVCIFCGLLATSLKMIRLQDSRPWGAGFFVLLAVIVVMGSVHDLFFQRGFWFLLGIFASISVFSSAAVSKVDTK